MARTVEEMFVGEKIEQLDIMNMQGESDYWESAGHFILDNWARDVDTMSPKQRSWLNRIHEDLVEKRIEGKL